MSAASRGRARRRRMRRAIARGAGGARIAASAPSAGEHERGDDRVPAPLRPRLPHPPAAAARAAAGRDRGATRRGRRCSRCARRSTPRSPPISIASAADAHPALRARCARCAAMPAPLLDALADVAGPDRGSTPRPTRGSPRRSPRCPRELRAAAAARLSRLSLFRHRDAAAAAGRGARRVRPDQGRPHRARRRRSIRAGGAEATLKGIQFNSFGAFFSRAYRENDYLWGRLHGAERMIDIIVSTLPADTRLKPGRVAAIKRAAFLAILDEEEPRLTAIAPACSRRSRREIG